MAPIATRIFITTGPESCGKTTLAGQLSASLACPLVQEASRPYLRAQLAERADYQYRQLDLNNIARIQYSREQFALESAPSALVCDTDLLVIIIWSEVKYGSCDPSITQRFKKSLSNTKTQRLYLLCDHNIAWQPDPLRENPYDRDRLFALYEQKLRACGLEYLVISGSMEARLQQSLDAVTGPP